MISCVATEGVEVKVVLALVALLVVGGGAIVLSGVLGPSEEGMFHPDHTRVFNGFQDATSDLVGGDGVSSVPPPTRSASRSMTPCGVAIGAGPRSGTPMPPSSSNRR